MTAINILLNGETRELPAETNLDMLLDFFSLPAKRIAVELNKTVIPRAEWGQIAVNDGDQIEVVHFVGGG
ncbi:MAG: sulfur carrier protein ThiS [Pyrinomonadaceae bacterium]